MANIITAIVMAAKIDISVMIYDAGSCCIIKVRIADIYHLAGIIQENHCKSTGIFSMGNIIPESIITGSMNSIPETRRAVT